MKFINTPKLKTHIEHLYEKVRPFAEQEGIFKPLDLHFCDTILGTGSFCYSGRRGYHYGDVEIRGEVSTETFDNLFDLTYEIFKYQTQMMAISYRSKIDIKGQDFRRITFPKQIELLHILGEEYAQKLEKELEEILRQVPYDD